MYLQGKGKFSKQAHVAIPDGCYEEEFGREGFFGPVSQLYHTNPPTGWTRIEGNLRPHAFDGNKAKPGSSVVPDRTTLLYNDDVSFSIEKPKGKIDWFFRNADGDEVVFIHQGKGTVQTDFGPLSFAPGDYIVIPRGTTYRFLPDTKDNFFVVIESKSPIREPERGMLGRHALYDQTVIETPEPKPLVEDKKNGEWEIKVKRLNEITSIFYPYPPLDVAGWKGDLSVWKLNVKDICPVMSHRAHLPPSVHTTMLGRNFVICTFLPRPLETEPDAVKVPFFHRNIDFDEVLFYHDGDFFSRDGIQPGMITMHPQGIHHGPHPKAIESSKSKTDTNEIAVMLDARNPLHITEEAKACEWLDYWKSWQ